MYYECKGKLNTLGFVKKIYEEGYKIDGIKDYQIAIAQVYFTTMKDEDIYYFYKVEISTGTVYRYSSDESRCSGEKQIFIKPPEDTNYFPEEERNRRNEVQKAIRNLYIMNTGLSIQSEIKKDMGFFKFLYPNKYFDSVIQRIIK